VGVAGSSDKGARIEALKAPKGFGKWVTDPAPEGPGRDYAPSTENLVFISGNTYSAECSPIPLSGCK